MTQMYCFKNITDAIHKYLWRDETVFKIINFIILVKLTKKNKKKVNF